MKWPGHAAAGAVCDQPVSSCDLFPTLLSMAGIRVDPSPRLDGLDVSRLLQDPTAELAPRPLYFHFPHYYPTTTPVSAIRVGSWKLLEYLEDRRVELYDLAADPRESTDLSQTRPDRAQALRGQLQQWRQDVDAQMPDPNPAWEGH
jgi:arylsulfatase A